MPGTRYRLTPLLERRKRLEEEKQRLFASRQRALDESLDELRRLTTALRTGTTQLCEPTRPVRALDLRVHDAHLRYLEATIDAQRRHAAELEAALGRAREELTVANRERRVIEKLEERRRQAVEDERARREELDLDDANARRHERAARERLARGRAEKPAL